MWHAIFIECCALDFAGQKCTRSTVYSCQACPCAVAIESVEHCDGAIAELGLPWIKFSIQVTHTLCSSMAAESLATANRILFLVLDKIVSAERVLLLAIKCGDPHNPKEGGGEKLWNV